MMRLHGGKAQVWRERMDAQVMVRVRTGWDQASSCVPSSIEIVTCHPAGRATVHVASLVLYWPRSALNKWME